MSWAEERKPASLDQIVGQPDAVAVLTAFLENPNRFNRCIALVGGTGTGKTTAAEVLARGFNCVDTVQDGLSYITAATFNKEAAEKLFCGSDLHTKPLFSRSKGDWWRVVILEEMEWLHPDVQRILKVQLQPHVLSPRAIVIVTSNNVDKLDRALMGRFARVDFDSGQKFADACQPYIRYVWKQETKLPMPDLSKFGWQDKQFSLRDALDSLERYAVRLEYNAKPREQRSREAEAVAMERF